MSGWIKLQRQIFDHWITDDPEYLLVWLRMLTEANFESKTRLFNGSFITVKRGDLIFGLQAYSAKTGVSISKLRRLLSLLESDSMISRQKNNKYSLISILNYEKHQGDDSQDDSQTASEPQANRKRTATPKEVKNIRTKEVKNKDSNTPDKKPSDKKGKVKSDTLDFSSWPSLASEQVFNDWVMLRKAKHSPITQTVINQFGKELQKACDHGYTVDRALSEVVEAGWTGFKCDWLINRNSVNTKQSKKGFDIDNARSALGGFLSE